MSWQVAIGALFFLGMGVVALVSPRFVVGLFGMGADSADARNEVRAVYGGFGVAIAGLLGSTAFVPELARGVSLSVAVALLGMAFGRVVAIVVERPGPRPWIFLAVETALAVLLLTGIEESGSVF